MSKELIEELNNSFKAFQMAYDEQLEKVKAGLSTAVTSDKVEALNAQITKLQGDIEEAKKAHNQAAMQIAALEIGGMGSGKKVDRETLALQATQFYARKNGNDNQKIGPQEIEGYSAYCKAFAAWVRRGDALDDPEIRNAMQVGSDPNGGYWVPTEKLSEVLKKLHETSPMREVADVMNITGDSIEFMTDMDLATSGGWVGETETRGDTETPGLGMQTMYVREQYAQPKATQKLLDMSTVNVEAWLMAKISEILTLTENTAYVSGSGVKSPRGFLDYASAAVTTADKTRAWGVLQYVATGEAGGFPMVSGLPGAHDADFLINLTTALRAPFRAGAVFAMNRLTEAEFRKLKDADGRYLITGGIEGAFTGFQLGGFPIRHFEDMPVIGSNSYSVAFGNFRQGYQILDGRGLRVLRDPYTQKPFVKFYTTKWTGGDIKRFDAIKLLKFSAS